jgi:hypothetical protein
MLLIMSTFVTGKYLAFTVALTTTATNLKSLLEANLTLRNGFASTLQDSWREITIQPDPEGTADTIYVGDAALGTTVGGQLQKGVVLLVGDSQTESSTLTLVPLGSIFVQAKSTTPSINVQLFPQ